MSQTASAGCKPTEFRLHGTALCYMGGRLLPPDEAERRFEALKAMADKLPELTRYRDTGCDLSPSCLDCTLPKCRYDLECGRRSLRNLDRDEEIARLRFEEHLSTEMLMRRFRIGKRTVHRILKRQRKGG